MSRIQACRKGEAFRGLSVAFYDESKATPCISFCADGRTDLGAVKWYEQR